MSNKYVEQILTAMEIISSAQINQSQKDITIQAKITSKENSERYSIEYQGKEYQGISGGKDYLVGDIVFVTCPNGIDSLEEKIIVGKKSVQEELVEDILDKDNDYINIGSNIKQDSEFDNELLQQLWSKIDGIRLSAEFTAIPKIINEDLNYGIELTFNNGKTFVLDINDMIGYPYYYPTATTQEKIILKEQIGDFTKITSCVFFTNPENTTDFKADNISIFAIIKRNKITQDEVLVINRSNTNTLENNDSEIQLKAFLISRDEEKTGAYSWEVKSEGSEEWITLSEQKSQTIVLSPATVWAKKYQIRGVITPIDEDAIYSESIDIVNALGLTVNVSREENTLVIDNWDQYTGVVAYLWQVKDVHGQLISDKERKFRTYPIDPTTIEISNEYIGSAFVNGVYIGSDSEFVTQVIPPEPAIPPIPPAKIYSLSLSNDREMVAITSSGKPLAGADGVIASTAASVWEDNTQITNANIILTAPDSFYNGEGDNKVLNSELIVFNGGKLQLYGLPDESVDSYIFTFKYQISEGNVLQEDFIVKKFASEEDYSLQIATPVVNLTTNPIGTIMFYVTKRDTNGLTKLAYESSTNLIEVTDADGVSIETSGDSFSIEHKIPYNKDTAFPLTITLTVNGIVWDEEEIEAVKNGNNGDTVKTISAYILTKDKSPSPSEPLGSNLGSWNLNYQTPTKDKHYLWRSDCEVVNGNYGNWSDPILVEEYSLKVTKVEEEREETVYYYSTISLDTPTIKIDATSGNISDDSNDSPNWTGVIPDDNGTFILWKAIRLKITPVTYFEDNTSLEGMPIYSLLSGPTRYGKLGDAIEGFNTVTNNGTIQGGFYGLNVGVISNSEAEVVKENDTYLVTSIISLTDEDLVKQKIYVIYDSDKKEINKVTEGTANALSIVFKLTDYDYYVNASMIKTGILDANLIDVVNLQAQKLLVKNSEGETLLDAGATNSNEVTIAGFNVSSDSISNGVKKAAESVYLGIDGIYLGSKFSVDNQGNMKATSGIFSGDITGASGTFSGNLSGSTISGSTIQSSTLIVGKQAGIRSDDNKQIDSLVTSGKTSPVRFWSGESGNDYTFVVLADGSLYATAAQFTGANITIDDDVKLGDQTVGEVKQDVSTANNKADNAVTTAGEAKTAAITAQNSATASAAAAAGSASAAATSASNSSTSEGEAAKSATAAAKSAEDAAESAKEAVDSNTSATAIANQASQKVGELGTAVEKLQNAGYQTKTDVENIIDKNENGFLTSATIPDEYITEEELTGKGYATTSEVDALKQQNADLKEQIEKLQTELNNRPTKTQVEQMIQEALNNGGGESGEEENNSQSSLETFVFENGETIPAIVHNMDMNYLVSSNGGSGMVNCGQTTLKTEVNTTTKEAFLPIIVTAEGVELLQIDIYCMIKVDSYYTYPSDYEITSLELYSGNDNMWSGSCNHVGKVEYDDGVMVDKYTFKVSSSNNSLPSRINVRTPTIIIEGYESILFAIFKVDITTTNY